MMAAHVSPLLRDVGVAQRTKLHPAGNPESNANFHPAPHGRRSAHLRSHSSRPIPRTMAHSAECGHPSTRLEVAFRSHSGVARRLPVSANISTNQVRTFTKA